MKKIFSLLVGVLLASCTPEVIPDKEKFPDRIEVEYGTLDLPMEQVDNVYLFEGDIMIPKAPANKAAIRTTGLWEDNTVIYLVDPNLPNAYRVADAIAHWETNTNLRFKLRTTERDYVYFTTGSGCSSYVGKIGGMQKLTVSSTCSTGNTIHEIGHAVGFWHEHSRSDRDKFVTIQWDNVAAGREHNFETFNESNMPSMNIGNALDFNSIMMYGSYSFSANGKPTIVKKDGSVFGGQRKALSQGDIDGVNSMYPIKEPVYENGKIYFILGVYVLKYRDRWHFETKYGWKVVYRKGDYWFYL